MENQNKYLRIRSIIFLVALTALLFVLSFFYVALPAIKENFLNDKKEMIKELTTTVWKILQNYERRVHTGEFSVEEAKARAKLQIEPLRYGPEGKDYFWINDMRPYMVMHPYRKDLIDEDISDYKDSKGKFLFLEFVKVVTEDGEGYVDYMWQWKDDETKVVEKLSYVKGFSPWGWIIGTGVYLDDVDRKVNQITKKIKITFICIIVCLILLIVGIVFRIQGVEKDRQSMINDLIDAKKQYTDFIRYFPDLIIIYGKYVEYINEAGLSLLKAKTSDDILKRVFVELVAVGQKEKVYALIKESLANNKPFSFKEGRLIALDGKEVDVELIGIPFFEKGRTLLQIVARSK